MKELEFCREYLNREWFYIKYRILCNFIICVALEHKLISHDIKIKIKEYKNIVINNTAHYYNIEDQKKILNDVERLQILPFLEKLPNLNNILTYNSVMCEDICDLLKKNIGNKIIINK